MKIGVLVTGHAPEMMIGDTGDYDTIFSNMLADEAFEFSAYNVVDGEFPTGGAQDADGWVITGSKHGAYEDHDWIAPLEELIRDIDGRGQPLLGVCFGHQIIAQALGGKVEKFKGGWSVGRTTYRLGDDDITLNGWHQDQVVERPARARVLGGDDFCENGILAYDDHIWTVQLHPEYGPDFLQGLINHRGPGVVPQDLLSKAEADLRGPLDNDKIADFMKAFLKKGKN